MGISFSPNKSKIFQTKALLKSNPIEKAIICKKIALQSIFKKGINKENKNENQVAQIPARWSANNNFHNLKLYSRFKFQQNETPNSNKKIKNKEITFSDSRIEALFIT